MEWRFHWSLDNKIQNDIVIKTCWVSSETERAFCLLNSFVEVKPSMRNDTMKHFRKIQNKRLGNQGIVLLHHNVRPHLLVSLKTLLMAVDGSSAITWYTAPILHLLTTVEFHFCGKQNKCFFCVFFYVTYFLNKPRRCKKQLQLTLEVTASSDQFKAK